MKTVGSSTNSVIGPAKARWVFQFTAAAYNLVRMRSLLGDCAPADRAKRLEDGLLKGHHPGLCHGVSWTKRSWIAQRGPKKLQPGYSAACKSFRPKEETHPEDTGPGAPRRVATLISISAVSTDQRHPSFQDRPRRPFGQDQRQRSQALLSRTSADRRTATASSWTAPSPRPPQSRTGGGPYHARERERKEAEGKLTVGADRDTTPTVRGRRPALHVTRTWPARRRFNAIGCPHTSCPATRLSPAPTQGDRRSFRLMKTTGTLGKLLHRGLAKVTAVFTFACAAYNFGQTAKTPGGASFSLSRTDENVEQTARTRAPLGRIGLDPHRTVA